MARGWESKSVEAQQEEASAQSHSSRPLLTPEQIERRKILEGLNLSRSRTLQQLERACNSRHQQMLRQALMDLESKIRELMQDS